MTELILPPVQRTLLFSGVLLLTGAVAWNRFILPALPEEMASPGSLSRRVVGIGLGSTGLLAAVWVLRLVVQLQGFRDPFVPLREDLEFVVLETVWGWVWIAQAGYLILMAGSLWKRWWLGAEVAVLGLALSLALSSHAMSVPFNRPLAVAVDASHTLAAGAWMGTLAIVLATARGRHNATLPPQLQAFSPLAMASVGVLLFMGVVLSGVHLGQISNLWASSYGRVLSLKIVLACGVLLLGLVNWRRGLPRLDLPEGRREIRRRAGLEVALAMLVLVATAILTGTPMPEGVHHG